MPSQMTVVAPNGYRGLGRSRVDRLARDLAGLSPRQPVTYARIEVAGPIPAGTTLARAHRNWSIERVATREASPAAKHSRA